MTRFRITTALALACLAGAAPSAVAENPLFSSHSDAPQIKQDPQANLTDVYAFIGTRYDDPTEAVLNVVAHVRPFSEPGDGPHYDRFADDARYSIHITDPATGRETLRYDFRFSPVDGPHLNDNTILSYGLGTEAGPIQELGDNRQNYFQTYSVRVAFNDDDGDDESGWWRRHRDRSVRIGKGVPVAVPNAGNNVTPLYNDADGRAVSGAASFDELDDYTRQAVTPLHTGEVVFAGPREDPFYADIPGTFDLLNVRILDNNGTLADGLGQDGGGVDGFKGFNTLCFAVQIPLSSLDPSHYNSVFFGPQTGVGVYASVSRPRVTYRDDRGDVSFGQWVQVNRLGNPLFNEALVPLSDKDRFNRVQPGDDADQSFAAFARTPELAGLINFVYGTDFATEGRDDLVNIFIPDVLRVNTETGPVRLSGEDGFSRFGFLGGDTTDGVSSGWPNGRRLGDDVIDIALSAIASGPTYETLTVVGDNVAENDTDYNRVFPYAATPNAGTNNSKDQ